MHVLRKVVQNLHKGGHVVVQQRVQLNSALVGEHQIFQVQRVDILSLKVSQNREALHQEAPKLFFAVGGTFRGSAVYVASELVVYVFVDDG